MNKRIAAGVASAALVMGGTGAALVIPHIVAAADPTASPDASTAPASASAPTASSAPNVPGVPGAPGNGYMPRGGGRGGAPMGADDITSAAKALGMSEADVTTALEGGQTLAQLAAGQNVDAQTLIDGMVAAEKAEIQADVSAGNATQAQADQEIANLTQHETDEVNGVMGGGFGGRGAAGSHAGRPNDGDADDAPSPSTAPTTTTTNSTTGSTTS